MAERSSRTPGWWAALVVVVVLGIGAPLVLVTRPFSEDILDLLPRDDPVIAGQYAFLSSMHVVGTIVAECSAGDSTVPFSSVAAATRAVSAEVLADSLFVPGPTLTPADFMALKGVLTEHWPELFSDEDSAWLAARMQRDSLAARFGATIEALFTISDRAVDAHSLRHDPFDFAPVVLKRLAAFRPAESITIRDGLISDTGGTRTLFVVGVRSDDLDESTSRAVASAMARGDSVAAALGCRLTWMSAHRAALDNSRTIRRDVNRTAPLTAVLIMLLCVAVYRRFYYGLLVFVPTLLGVATAMAGAALAGTLSIIVLGFAATLIGITVDYAVHYFFHVENHPEDTRPAHTLLPAIAASSLTTAGAFLVLTRAGIPGLSQLSVVAAAGIILVAVFSLTLLPALFGRPAVVRRSPRLDLGAWMTRFYAHGWHRRLLPVVVVGSLVLWVFVPRLVFDGDPDNLNGMRPDTRAAECRLTANWPGVMGGTYCAVHGSTATEAIERADARLRPLVESLHAEGLVEGHGVFTDILPPHARQVESRSRWRRFFTPERQSLLSTVIDSVAASYGLPGSRFSAYVDSIAVMEHRSLLDVSSLPEGFVQGVLQSYLCESDSGWYAAVPVVASGDTTWQVIARRAEQAGVLAVNDDVLGDRIVAIVRKGFADSLVLLPLVMLVVLIVVLRRPRLVLSALLPPVLATGMTLGGMAVLGLPVTIVSFMVLAFVFGLGIDYAVFLVHMCRQGTDASTAGRAAGSVTVAALTTIAGLGVTILARHPVLVSLGATGLLGIVSSYVCGVVGVGGMVKSNVDDDADVEGG